MFSLDNAVEAIRSNIFCALLVNIPIAAVSYVLKTVRISGLAAGLIYGIVIYALGGYRAFLVLFFFFLIGSIASRARGVVGKGHSARADYGQARGAGSVVGKCTVGAVLAVFIGLTGDAASGGISLADRGVGPWVALAYVGAFAAALADTCASELGPLHGRKAMLLATAEVVPHGTPGGVSITGTIFGVAGAMLVGLLGVVIGMLREEAIMFIVISSLAAIGIESLLRVRWSGGGFMAKQGCNLAVTAAGALCAVLLALAFGY